jgi:carboxyl-terminal processing protease
VTSRVIGRSPARVMVVRVERFSAGVAEQVERRVHAARRAHVNGLVLDLRGNPGGLVEEAIGLCSVFLDGGPVAQTAGAHVESARLTAARGGNVDLPLAVTVDGRTASSAEIVAAALQERGRATIVGSRTFGKTSVQEIVPLATGGALRLTVSHYRTPGGRDLRGTGVRPQEPIRSSRAVGHAATVIRSTPKADVDRRAARRRMPPER